MHVVELEAFLVWSVICVFQANVLKTYKVHLDLNKLKPAYAEIY